MRKALLVGLISALLLVPAAPALATAWSPWYYRMTVWVNYPQKNVGLCTRAGILDIAKNRSETKTIASGTNCSSTTSTVPAGYLAAGVDGYRDGVWCGYSGSYYSDASYAIWWVEAHMCSNWSGSEAYHTRARGDIYNDGTGGGTVGYKWFNTTSPSQNY